MVKSNFVLRDTQIGYHEQQPRSQQWQRKHEKQRRGAMCAEVDGEYQPPNNEEQAAQYPVSPRDPQKCQGDRRRDQVQEKMADFDKKSTFFIKSIQCKNRNEHNEYHDQYSRKPREYVFHVDGIEW